MKQKKKKRQGKKDYLKDCKTVIKIESVQLCCWIFWKENSSGK